MRDDEHRLVVVERVKKVGPRGEYSFADVEKTLATFRPCFGGGMADGLERILGQLFVQLVVRESLEEAEVALAPRRVESDVDVERPGEMVGRLLRAEEVRGDDAVDSVGRREVARERVGLFVAAVGQP